jgi:chemotaxis protein MotB
MARKHKCPPPGAPDWLLTYGDMMSLLLTFFILLVSLSELKKEEQYTAIVREVKKAFGMHGGGGRLPTKDDPELSLIQRLDALQLHQQDHPNYSNTEDPGMEGREQTVTKVREGMKFAIGGLVTFEPGSADLTERAMQQLRSAVIQHKIRGTKNIIELRGHAAAMELAEAQGRFTDLWDLSAARAKTVMNFLTNDDLGLEPNRFRLTARADFEPLVQRAYTMPRREPNRRVELIVSEDLVQDFTQPQSPTNARE